MSAVVSSGISRRTPLGNMAIMAVGVGSIDGVDTTFANAEVLELLTQFFFDKYHRHL